MSRPNKYGGRCSGCAADVPAGAGTLGARVGRGRGRHTEVYCARCRPTDVPSQAGAALGGAEHFADPDVGDLDLDCPVPPSFRHADGRRSVTAYFPNTGAVIYQNADGRCIDAPCCGCCSP